MDKESGPADEAPAPKRRKVRKGTQSCWECRRRKIRCTFTAPPGSVCDGCKRRNTTCISQEFPNTSNTLNGGQQADDRLSRLEGTVEWLVQKVGPDDTSDVPEDHPAVRPLAARSVQREDRASTCDAPGSNLGRAASSILDVEVGAPRTSCVTGENVCPSRGSGSDNGTGYDEVTRKLVSAWPSERDLELILNAPFEFSGVFHGTICAPYSTLFREQAPTPREILRLPPPRSHPVLIAQKLLTLAVCLQSLPRSSIRHLSGLDVDFPDIMATAVKTVRDCVTGNDELLESVEGIECVMMEAAYHSNAGQLHRSWRALRRAMLAAQMIGLHRSYAAGDFELPSSVFIEAGTRARVYPGYMWFRLVQWDRYLSLMLGLPQGTSSNSFADRSVLEGLTPMERMQRIDCAVGGYTIQRNETGLHDLATTRRVDRLLQRSSASLPPQWWLAPRFSPGIGIGDNIEELEKVVRVMDQFTHFHLVTQLHLPYLLRPSSEHEYDYSKITAVNSSREALQRFVSYLGEEAVTSFCRGINTIAFISCTVLGIAHINAHREALLHPHNSRDTVFDTLAHHRHSDRAIMELTLESMEQTARESDDVLARKTADILTHLLAIEADAALSGDYVTSPSAQNAGDRSVCSGKLVEGGRMLQIHLPYLGGVRFERGGGGGGSHPTTALSRPVTGNPRATPVPATLLPDVASLTSLLPIPEPLDEIDQRSLAATTPVPGSRSLDSTAKDRQVASPHRNQLQQPRSALSMYQNNGVDSTYFPREQLFLPVEQENLDGWTLQDVDIDTLEAIFDEHMLASTRGV